MAGLLLDPATDLWGDWGLLGVPDPAQKRDGQQAPQLFRDFITAAYPGYAFHTWAERLIALLQRVADGELNRMIVCCPPRLGKLCAHDTPVPTPDGWRRHGDLRPGDQVFGPDGRPTRVVAISAEARATMRVTTTRGEEIWCHPQHEWTVRKRRRLHWETLTTAELATQELHTGRLGHRGSRFLYQLPQTEPLQYSQRDLPMDPYSLGYWLGNGSLGKPLVTHDREDLAPVVAMVRAGYSVSAVHPHRTPGYERVRATSLAGLFTRKGQPSPLRLDLLAAGVLHHKHIPEAFLRGSIDQRLALLAGLIDSDGSVDCMSRVVFSTTSLELAEGVEDLAEGLGFRPYRTELDPRTSSSGFIGRLPLIQVGFQPTMAIPTRLERKAIRRLAPQRHLAIARIDEVPDSEHWGRCIQVDRRDGLYLVGRRLTATHNSLLVSKLFPAYWVSRYPQSFCAIASYSAELAYAHSREARHYYRSCGHALSKDSTAVGNWLTPERGGCIAAGVRGPFTGKGYALGIIDDPYKGPEDANSAGQRQKLVEWFQSVWLTRSEPGAPEGPSMRGPIGAAQVVVLTRWHQDDLIGWLLAQESGDAPQHWHVLNLPAIAELPAQQLTFPPSCTVEPDWRQPGEALCPERFPPGELDQIRIRAGSYWWNALYQQRPSPAEGLLFQRQWIRTCSGRPGQRPSAAVVLSCDLSFKGGQENDYCGFCLLGLLPDPDSRHPVAQASARGEHLHPRAARVRAPAQPMPSIPTTTKANQQGGPSHRIEVLWSEHHRLDLPGVVKFLSQTLAALAQQGRSPDAVLIEDAANGPAVCQLLRRQIPGLIAVRPQGSKVSRAHAVAPLLEAGQLAFHSGNDALISELLGFPNAAHDDLVDAFCQGVIWLQTQHWRGSGKATPRSLLFSR
jgi:predicted phage terminase large subunit-like protein